MEASPEYERLQRLTYKQLVDILRSFKKSAGQKAKEDKERGEHAGAEGEKKEIVTLTPRKQKERKE